MQYYVQISPKSKLPCARLSHQHHLQRKMKKSFARKAIRDPLLGGGKNSSIMMRIKRIVGKKYYFSRLFCASRNYSLSLPQHYDIKNKHLINLPI